jgi:hypothetical protein
MRTETDLRAALWAREDLAPDLVAVRDGARRVAARRRRHRAFGVAAAGAGLLAVVAAVFVTVGQTSTGTELTARPTATADGTAAVADKSTTDTSVRAAYELTLTAVSVEGYTITPDSTGPDQQQATVRHDGAEAGYLAVFRPGSGMVSGLLNPRTSAEVSIHGRPGIFGSTPNSLAVQWEYAPGGSAFLAISEPIEQADAVRLAEAVRFQAPYQVRVPYRLSYLPAGFTMSNVVQRPDLSVVQLDGPNDVPDITVYPGPATTQFDWQPTTIAGHAAGCVDLIDGHRCAVDLGGYTVDIGGHTMTREVVKQIVAGMTFANFADPTSWFAFTDAYPM